MVGWHHWVDAHEFEQAPGVGDGQGSLVCCSPWGHKESDMTEQLNWTDTSTKKKRIGGFIYLLLNSICCIMLFSWNKLMKEIQPLVILLTIAFLRVFPDSSVGKESTCNAGDLGLISGLGRSPGEEKGYPLQNSGLENSMDWAMGSQRVRCDWATFTFIAFLSANVNMVKRQITVLLFMTTILTSRSSWKDLWDTPLLPIPTSPEICKSHFENHCPIMYSCNH